MNDYIASRLPIGSWADQPVDRLHSVCRLCVMVPDEPLLFYNIDLIRDNRDILDRLNEIIATWHLDAEYRRRKKTRSKAVMEAMHVMHAQGRAAALKKAKISYIEWLRIVNSEVVKVQS